MKVNYVKLLKKVNSFCILGTIVVIFGIVLNSKLNY